MFFFNFQNSVEKKEKWEKKFKKLRTINERHSLIWGDVIFISNTNPSAGDFNQLRSKIVEVAKTTPDWGMDYPVKWIYLEDALNNKRENTNILTLNEVMEVAKNCSVPTTSFDEVILFLSYQHAIGNLIFYNETNLKDCVILKPTWLIDAFKCIVYADKCKTNQNNPLSFPEFTLNGKISKHDLKKLIEYECSKYEGHLETVIGVVEKFDIIVNDKSDSYICPSAIRKMSSPFETICENKHINDKTCFRSSWLCLEFDFLPPALYNHLLVFCMCDNNFVNPELFYEIGIFCINRRNELDKFFLCKSGRTIALQMFSTCFDDNSFKLHCDKIPNTQTLFENILEKIQRITSKYGFRVQCKPKIKCGKADYVSEKQRYPLDGIRLGNCTHCGNATHNYENLSNVWIKVSNAKS